MMDAPEPVTLVLVGASAKVIESGAMLAKILADSVGSDIDLQIPDSPPPEVEWLATISLEGLPAPLVCWYELNAIEGLGLPDVSSETPCLVVQSLLHPADPLTCLSNLLRLLVLADPAARGILDANTSRWLERDMLVCELMETDVEPREDLLWIVTCESEDECHHLQTSGMTRCGRHELAIETAEASYVETAADLLASTAALCLETPLPESGAVIEVGPGLHLRISGSSDEVESLANLEDAEHGGPPEQVLRRLTEDSAALYRTERSTARHRALAIHTWESFQSLVESLLRTQAECFVEVPWEDASGDEVRREHLWMEVQGTRGDDVLAVPAHQGDLVRGVPTEPSTVTVDEVCSWRVILDGNVWGPEQLPLLMSHLEREAT
jgi:hypothetical protein